MVLLQSSESLSSIPLENAKPFYHTFFYIYSPGPLFTSLSDYRTLAESWVEWQESLAHIVQKKLRKPFNTNHIKSCVTNWTIVPNRPFSDSSNTWVAISPYHRNEKPPNFRTTKVANQWYNSLTSCNTSMLTISHSFQGVWISIWIPFALLPTFICLVWLAWLTYFDLYSLS